MLAGVVLVTEAWVWESADLVGIGAGLVAAVCLGGYLLLTDRMGGLPPLLITTWGRFVGALTIFPLVGIGPMNLPASHWWLLGFAALAGTVAVFLEAAAVHRAGPGPVGTVLVAQPALAANLSK